MIYTSPTIPLKEDEVHEITQVKKTPAKKKKSTPKKKEVSQRVKTTEATIQLAQPKITTEQKKVEVEQKKPAVRQVKVEQPKSRILQVKQGQILKSPADIAYTTNIPVDALNSAFRKISQMKPKGGAPLIQEQGSEWKMNYSLEYILSLQAVQEVLRGVEAK
jgi:hypothetical protein